MVYKILNLFPIFLILYFTIQVNCANIGDKVWIDNYPDGIQQTLPGFPGLELGKSGVQVRLVQFGMVIDTVTTSGSGIYTFTGLAAGSYTIRVPLSQSTDIPTIAFAGGDVTIDSNGQIVGPNVEANVTLGATNDLSIDFGFVRTTGIRIIVDSGLDANENIFVQALEGGWKSGVLRDPSLPELIQRVAFGRNVLSISKPPSTSINAVICDTSNAMFVQSMQAIVIDLASNQLVTCTLFINTASIPPTIAPSEIIMTSEQTSGTATSLFIQETGGLDGTPLTMNPPLDVRVIEDVPTDTYEFTAALSAGFEVKTINCTDPTAVIVLSPPSITLDFVFGNDVTCSWTYGSVATTPPTTSVPTTSLPVTSPPATTPPVTTPPVTTLPTTLSPFTTPPVTTPPTSSAPTTTPPVTTPPTTTPPNTPPPVTTPPTTTPPVTTPPTTNVPGTTPPVTTPPTTTVPGTTPPVTTPPVTTPPTTNVPGTTPPVTNTPTTPPTTGSPASGNGTLILTFDFTFLQAKISNYQQSAVLVPDFITFALSLSNPTVSVSVAPGAYTLYALSNKNYLDVDISISLETGVANSVQNDLMTSLNVEPNETIQIDFVLTQTQNI